MARGDSPTLGKRPNTNLFELSVLLIDQVQLLGQNITHLGSFRVSLPMLGGVGSVREAYEYVHLIHPARDIITTIKKADPLGDKLPQHL